MYRRLEIELYGPCSLEDNLKPEMNDTVAIIENDGRVRFVNITGANIDHTGTPVLYGHGGERLLYSDCYLIYTSDPDSTDS